MAAPFGISLNTEKKKLNGNYTRMLHAVLSKFWKQHSSKQQLYEHTHTHTHTHIYIYKFSSMIKRGFLIEAFGLSFQNLSQLRRHFIAWNWILVKREESELFSMAQRDYKYQRDKENINWKDRERRHYKYQRERERERERERGGEREREYI